MLTGPVLVCSHTAAAAVTGLIHTQCPQEGEIVAFKVADGDPVEYGEYLASCVVRTPALLELVSVQVAVHQLAHLSAPFSWEGGQE